MFRAEGSDLFRAGFDACWIVRPIEIGSDEQTGF
jgi:hypothetical protein